MEENNMDPKEIKKLVSDTKDDIKELKSTLNELQETCTHKETTVKNISTSVAELRKVCKTCEKVLGYPNKNEMKDAGY
jgi:uncharacterized coiled-coil protein SlyX